MLTIYQRTLRNEALAEIPDIKPGVWVEAIAPTEQETARLVAEGGLDTDLLKDAADFFEAPRLEMKNGIVYFFTRFPHKNGTELTTSPLLIAISPHAIFTITHIMSPALLEFGRSGTDIFTTQKAKFFLLLMQQITTMFQKHILEIRKEIYKGQSNIHAIDNRTIAKFVSLESTLNDFLNTLTPMNQSVEAILSGKYLELYADDRELVEDLSLALEQLATSTQTSLRGLQNIRSAYATVISNNLNQVLKFLAALTVMLTIPMVVSSFFGMNVHLPFAEHPLAFAGILIFTILSVLIVAYVFSKKEWV